MPPSGRLLRALRAAVAAVVLPFAFSAARAAPEAPAAPLPAREVAEAERSAIPSPDLRAYLGIVVESSASGVRVTRVVPGSPAEAAGLRPADLVRSVGDVDLATGDDLDRALDAWRPGDAVAIAVVRGGRPHAVAAKLGGRRAQDGVFRRPVFRLAVVPLRFSDDVGAPVPADRLRRLLFETTGRTGRGASLADYYRAQSLGRLAVEGEILAPIVLPSPRSHYAPRPMGAAEGSAFQDAADLLHARHGDTGLADHDGVAFLYGGEPETRAGLALWPHRSAVLIGARRMPYYVHATGGAEGMSIGIHCHEFGHLLGLADAYGAGHRTGCGDFCVMAIGHRGGPETGADAPFSLCAQCRLRLGWIEPAVVDPRVAQRVRLRPGDAAADQALLVPLDARCDEYLLLEVRARRGFDAELPSEGLLVWHVGGNPPPGQSIYAQPVDLVEAHGVATFDASLVRIDEIAFPTARCADLTPDTRPAVVPATRDGFPPYLTDLVREADGSVVLTLGVRKRVTQAAPAPFSDEAPDRDGFVVRVDPITGEDARFYVGPRELAPRPPSAGAAGQQERR